MSSQLARVLATVPQADLYTPFAPDDLLALPPAPALEQSFFSGFKCCGIQLRDFHDLIQHFEDIHCLLTSEDGSKIPFNPSSTPPPPSPTASDSSQSEPSTPLTPSWTTDLSSSPFDSDFHAIAAFDDIQVHDTKSEQCIQPSLISHHSPTIRSPTPSVFRDAYHPILVPSITPRLVSPSPSTLDDYSPCTPPPLTDDSSSSSASSPSSPSSPRTSFVIPSLLSTPPSPSPSSPIDITSVNRSYSETSLHVHKAPFKKSKHSSGRRRSHHPQSFEELRSKPHKCPRPNCVKSYLNPNGLRYHLTKGTCEYALRSE
ncbi:hypothetical protein SISSUDRAFT_1061402 [Sistotremastrum suecicum HHB10207 ss-3]|uniref:C2H2-type domain-containing protein n=1 Tax=Sistotremastrum suecicum HHB10207 ss-3 TaxID=1314776 RepID=A0A166E1C8_9AGAM|nr:hypothetical protein SISSUDRAFT_1061402 [Sistotremastrum suecicum HHB10207 ss-3]